MTAPAASQPPFLLQPQQGDTLNQAAWNTCCAMQEERTCAGGETWRMDVGRVEYR